MTGDREPALWPGGYACPCKVTLGVLDPCGTHEDAGYEGVECDCARCVALDAEGDE